MKHISKNPNNVVFIRVMHNLVKINLQDILVINAVSNYVVIDIGKKKYTLANTLGHLMKRLPANDFVRVHKSHVVRVDRITEVRKNFCFVDNKKIPISRRLRAPMIARLVII